jgi:hypothetical protein
LVVTSVEALPPHPLAESAAAGVAPRRIVATVATSFLYRVAFVVDFVSPVHAFATPAPRRAQTPQLDSAAAA